MLLIHHSYVVCTRQVCDPPQLCCVHTASVRSIAALHCIHRDRVGEGEGEGEGEGVFVFKPLPLPLTHPSGNHLHRVISSRVNIPIYHDGRLTTLFR